MKKFTIEMDTAVDIIPGSDRDLMMDRYGDNEEEELLKFMNKHNIEYEVIDENGPGGGWPIIEYTGTKEALCNLLTLFSTTGQTLEEIKEILSPFDNMGDEAALMEIIG